MDLVGNPEDRFSLDAVHILPSGLTSIGISRPPLSSRKNDGYSEYSLSGLFIRARGLGESMDRDLGYLAGLELSLPVWK